MSASIVQVQEKVNDVKSIMIANIDKIMEREEKLSLLSDKTDSLRSNAQMFSRRSKEVKHALQKKYVYIMLGVVFIFLLVVLIWVIAKRA